MVCKCTHDEGSPPHVGKEGQEKEVENREKWPHTCDGECAVIACLVYANGGSGRLFQFVSTGKCTGADGFLCRKWDRRGVCD